MARVALYCRVSTEAQEKDQTIQSQLARLREHSKKHEYEIFKEYLDDGFSGDLLARPALDRLRDDAEARRFDRVLVLAPDRLARKFIYGEVIADELKKSGITVEFLNHKDDGTEEGKLLLGITGLFAQYEKAKIVERTRRGRLHKAKTGHLVISIPPFGYHYASKEHGLPSRLVIDEPKAEIVRLIFSLCVAKSYSARQIVKELSMRKVSPPNRWGNSQFWATSTITKILGNETYAGTWHYNKHSSEEPFRRSKIAKVQRAVKTSRRLRPRKDWIAVQGVLPIIDRTTYEAAQEQRSKNRVFSSRNAHHQYLLTGLTQCGHCAHSFQGIPSHAKYYYRCSGPRIQRMIPRSCFNGSIKADRLEESVWIAISDAFRNPSLILGEMANIQAKRTTSRIPLEIRRADIARQKGQLKAGEGRLLDALSAGIINQDQVRLQMGTLKERESKLTELECALEAEAARSEIRTPNVEEYCRKIAKGLSVLDRDFEKKRNFLRSIVDKVIVEPDKIRIKGALSIAAGSDRNGQGGIAPTPSAGYARNATWQFELVRSI